MNYIKQNRRLSFVEFNNEWAFAGNFLYNIEFKDKKKAFEMEDCLFSLGFKSGNYVNWHDGRRRKFILRVFPRKKCFIGHQM